MKRRKLDHDHDDETIVDAPESVDLARNIEEVTEQLDGIALDLKRRHPLRQHHLHRNRKRPLDTSRALLTIRPIYRHGNVSVFAKPSPIDRIVYTDSQEEAAMKSELYPQRRPRIADMPIPEEEKYRMLRQKLRIVKERVMESRPATQIMTESPRPHPHFQIDMTKLEMGIVAANSDENEDNDADEDNDLSQVEDEDLDEIDELENEP